MVASIDSSPDLTTATDSELCEHVRLHQQSTWHYSCTARMGPRDDLGAVCDTVGRVLGVRGLRVCDCSLMPCVVSGNTYATALMLGHKIGMHCPATNYARPLLSDRHTSKL
jgi:choline dehydrogenase-like flavoprotein